VAGALLVELLIALLGTGLQAIDGKAPATARDRRRSAPRPTSAKLLLTRFLLAFESRRSCC